MRYLHKLATFIATAGYIGKIKFAPGTFGSLPAFPICYIIMHFTLKHQILFQIAGFNINELQFLSLFIIELIATIILFFIGMYFTAIYIKDMEVKDPSEVVIDEVVGQMLTVILCSASVILIYSGNLQEKIDGIYIDFLFLFLMPFVLFRLFDILKPWPINWLDNNLSGSFGVMIDDIAAAIFATTIHYVVVYLLIDYIM